MEAGRRNRAFALGLGGVAIGMVGLAYASVPLYRLFCQVTGYGGTTQVATEAPESETPVSDRVITVRFNADTAKDLPWRFRPAQRQVTVRIGETALAFYRATNTGGRRLTGTATFNVTPQKAGIYFSKIECFCFTKQTLAPGQEAEMPVSFFIDPDILDDRNLDEVRTITLSYTFFKAPGEEAGPTAPAAGLDTASATGPARPNPAVPGKPPGDSTDG